MKFLLMLALSIATLKAVIYIAPVDIGAKPGYSGSLKGSFQTKRGNTDSAEYSAGARLLYDSNNSYVAWADLAFSYAMASGTANTNKTYAHIRYIHSMYEKDFNWEVFVQSQTDKFTKIKKRVLSGIGLRYHSDMNKYGSMYLGFGGFAASVDYTSSLDPAEKNIRLNLYIAYKKDFLENINISYIGYYQPKVNEFGDYILSNSAQVSIQLYKKLYVNIEAIFNQDTKPAIGVKKYDFTQKTSFLYEF